METRWEGKSKGTVLGYKIFIWLLRTFGVRAAYALLYFVALYYCFFSIKSTKAVFYYLRHRQKFSFWKSIICVYKNYLVFGKTIIDKVAISSGMRDAFTYEFDGIENIKKLLQEKKGGVLLSAHVGNFEIAEVFFREIDNLSQINLVATDSEREDIKVYLESVGSVSKNKFITIKEDLSHIFEINNALSNGELVCLTGDRYYQGSKYLTEALLGQPAHFPAGPFKLASRLRSPVLFVYVMKETNKHYHLYARTATVKNRDAQGLLQKYVQSVEAMLQKYPLQWFNYFDFWETNEKK